MIHHPHHPSKLVRKTHYAPGIAPFSLSPKPQGGQLAEATQCQHPSTMGKEQRAKCSTKIKLDDTLHSPATPHTLLPS